MLGTELWKLLILKLWAILAVRGEYGSQRWSGGDMGGEMMRGGFSGESEPGTGFESDVASMMNSPEVLSLYRKVENPRSAPDLNELEKTQKTLAKKIQELTVTGEKLRKKAELLKRMSNATKKKGVATDAEMLNVRDVEEAEALKQLEEASKPRTEFTAPVIVVLEDPLSSLETMEILKSLSCRKKMGSAGHKEEEAKKLQELSKIKGATSQELENEVQSTKKELERVLAHRELILEKLKSAIEKGAMSEIEYLKHDFIGTDKSGGVLIKKLERLDELLEEAQRVKLFDL